VNRLAGGTAAATPEPTAALLDALASLAELLPACARAGRERIYGAIEALVLELVAALEQAGCDDDGSYRLLGRFLEQCRLLVDPPVGASQPPARPAALLALLSRR
jgi:hypothetical protein